MPRPDAQVGHDPLGYGSLVSNEEDESEPRISGWLHRHVEVVFLALFLVFLGYAASAYLDLKRGQLGPDDANVIGVLGGIAAAIAAGICCTVTVLRKRKAR